MAKSPAIRSKEKRLRRKHGERIERVLVGKGQIVIVVDQGDLAEALREAKLVQDWSIEDRAEVQAALLRAIARPSRHA